MAQITVKIHVNERNALFELAKQEYRRPQEQAALIIRRELEQRGLLPDTKQQPVAAVAGQEVNRERE
jgi:hypothetical protein